MPRDGAGYYHAPPGTDGAPDTTIDSAKYNLFVADLEQVLNSPMPIIGGGTGGGTIDEALNSLSAEKKNQVVANFDSFAFMSGSWSSGTTATNPPVAGHAFSGIAYVIDANNMTVEARDQDGAVRPGAIYVRQKKAGVWSAWATDAGGPGLGPMPAYTFKGNNSAVSAIPGDIDIAALTTKTPAGTDYVMISDQAASGAWKKALISAIGGSPGTSVTVSDIAPVSPTAGALWWESDTGLLYIWYVEPGGTPSSQWVAIAGGSAGGSSGGVTSFGGATGAITLGNGFQQNGQVLNQKNGIFIADRNNADQTGLTLNGDNKITWINVGSNADGWFNVTNGRYTPQVAGTYVFALSTSAPVGTGGANGQPELAKNGVISPFIKVGQYSGSAFAAVSNLVCAIPMNGTTDYVEAYIYIPPGTAGTTNVLYGITRATHFQAWREGA